jgi:hypothetical protein
MSTEPAPTYRHAQLPRRVEFNKAPYLQDAVKKLEPVLLEGDELRTFLLRGGVERVLLRLRGPLRVHEVQEAAPLVRGPGVEVVARPTRKYTLSLSLKSLVG